MPAAPTGPSAPADVWRKVFNSACFGFESEITGSEKDGYYLCTQSVKGPGYIKTVTIMSRNRPVRGGTLRIMGGELEEIEYRKGPAAGQVRFDVWTFDTRPLGVLERASHKKSMVTLGKIDEETTVDLDLAAPETAARYDAMLSFFVTYY